MYPPMGDWGTCGGSDPHGGGGDGGPIRGVGIPHEANAIASGVWVGISSIGMDAWFMGLEDS